MGYPRSHSVDPLRTGIYHCISRCVRRESLIESASRCSWIVATLERLCRVFAIDVCDFAVMRNHVHLLLRTHPELAMAWSDREVARRWLGRHGNSPPELEAAIEAACGDPSLVAEWRARLSDLGWFHKLWKEPAAKAWNREDDVTGHFWEGRFHSIGCHDEASILMQATYIVLNPVHCGLEAQPGKSGRTSLTRRIAKLRMAIGRGELREGVEAYRLALLEPAIPCEPGPEASQLADPEWSERLARRTHDRAVREEALESAYRSVRLARRPVEAALEANRPKEPSASLPCSSSIASPLISHDRPRPHRCPGSAVATGRDRAVPELPVSRKRNPWRGRTSLPILEGCTLVSFIELVDERSRMPRGDKPCHVPPGQPRLLDRILRDSAGETRSPGDRRRVVHHLPTVLLNMAELARGPCGSRPVRTGG